MDDSAIKSLHASPLKALELEYEKGAKDMREQIAKRFDKAQITFKGHPIGFIAALALIKTTPVEQPERKIV